jgi:hypothetical protein
MHFPLIAGTGADEYGPCKTQGNDFVKIYEKIFEYIIRNDINASKKYHDKHSETCDDFLEIAHCEAKGCLHDLHLGSFGGWKAA